MNQILTLGKIYTLFIASILTFNTSFSQGFSSQTQIRLQHVLDSIQNNPLHPFVGGITAAINVDGLALWQGATGFAARNVDAQNNPLTGGIPFAITNLSRSYSVTKTFTAVLVLELAREGKLNLNDAIINYLPHINLYSPSLNANVTIRQLLNHESGYSDWEEELPLQIAIAFNPHHIWTAYELAAFTHQLNAPGTVRRYSHNNYVFLEAIIEAATKQPLEQLYRQRFFEPLKLESIYLDGKESHGNRAPLAAPHDNISAFNPIFQLTGQPTYPDTYTNISAFPFTGITSLASAGGGLVSNATDLAEWSNKLFGGHSTSPGVLDSLLESIATIADENGNLLGYGVKNTNKISGSYDFIGHNGSAPGYRSVMFYNPEKKMTIVVLSNFAGADPYGIAAALYKALADFTCGNDNKKENKIQLCFNNNNLCVDRKAAHNLINKGARLGICNSEKGSNTNYLSTEKEITLPTIKTTLNQFPNPATNEISIVFNTKKPGKVTLSVYDINGRLITVLFEGIVEKDVPQRKEFKTNHLPAGMYFSRLQSEEGIIQKKFTIAR
jgi:CubicO group peptidase (beta-lactamase class C family)